MSYHLSSDPQHLLYLTNPVTKSEKFNQKIDYIPHKKKLKSLENVDYPLLDLMSLYQTNRAPLKKNV